MWKEIKRESITTLQSFIMPSISRYCHFNGSLFFLRAIHYIILCLCVCVSIYMCLQGIPTVIVANKCDMENGRVVRTDEGQALASDLRSVCVALTNNCTVISDSMK